MDLRNIEGFLDNTLMSTLQGMLDQLGIEEAHHDQKQQQQHHPSRAYVRDTKAMARTPADIIDLPSAYQFVVDMPGVKPSDVKVEVEDDNNNVVVVSGERKREKDEGAVKYLKMERRVGKFMRTFVLPRDANKDTISAVFQDGVLTVTVEKFPPPQPKKPKVIDVKAA